MTGPTVAGQPAADRLMAALNYQLHPSTPLLTRGQVAAVLRALADHTALEAARMYSRRDRLGPGDSPWPTTTSVGRWLYAVADQLINWASP